MINLLDSENKQKIKSEQKNKIKNRKIKSEQIKSEQKIELK